MKHAAICSNMEKSRMMSRTKARQNLLNSVASKSQDFEQCKDTEKMIDIEKSTQNSTIKSCLKHQDDNSISVLSKEDATNYISPPISRKDLLSDRTKHYLNRLGVLHSDSDQINLSSPVHAVHDIILDDGTVSKTKVLDDNESSEQNILKQTGCKLSKLSQLVSKVNEWQENDGQTFHINSNIKKDVAQEKKQPTMKFVNTCLSSSPNKDKKITTQNDLSKVKVKNSVTFAPIPSLDKEKKTTLCSPKKITMPTIHSTALSNTESLKSTLSPKKVDSPWQLSVAQRKALFEKQISNGGLAVPAPFTSTQNSSNVNPSNVKTKETDNNTKLFDDKPQVKNVIFKCNNTGNAKLDSNTNQLTKTEFTCTGHEQIYSKIQEKSKSTIECPETTVPTTMTSALIKNSSTSSLLNDIKIIRATPPKPGCLYPNISFDSDHECDVDDQIEESMDTNEKENYYTNDISPIISNKEKSNRPQKRHINSVLNKTLESSTSSLISFNEIEQNQCINGVTDIKRSKNYDTLHEQLNNSSNDSPFSGPLSTANNSLLGSPLQSSSFTYVDHAKSQENNNSAVFTPLVHTVSTYRKQQYQQLKPLAPIIKRTAAIKENFQESDEEIVKDSDNEDELDRVIERVHELEAQIPVQESIISQATQALNLCQATTEFAGSAEQVQAERLLLIAGLKRNACLMEVQRLRVEKTLYPRSHETKSYFLKSSITTSLIIKELAVPVRWDYIRNISIREDKRYHFVCVAQCTGILTATAQVVATQSVEASYTGNGNRSSSKSNAPGIPVGYIEFPGELRVDLGNIDENEVNQDFKCTVEVYGLVVDQSKLSGSDKFGASSSSHSNTRSDSKFWFTPTKNSKKKCSAFHGGSIESPGGPTAVRSTSFQLLGYFVFSKRELHRTQFTLSKVLYNGPLSEGVVQVKLELDDNENFNEESLSEGLSYEGFLTMFNDVSGFGAWHRRWFRLRNGMLSFWKYPEHAEDDSKIPLDTIDLNQCITQEVGPCSVELCARPNTLLFECTRPYNKNDGMCDSLITRTDPRTGLTTIRHLLSADTKQERQEWCDKLNSTLSVMRRRHQQRRKKNKNQNNK
ncbi:anillin isoform X2 [Daktulosphaira vitifoliae]|uniref:anillin isoform X2 n=1 Tax=Daktulosphaira vitifoliae TaxID=58002 RepID=UPI0021AA8062|nr:anillin isoform X2 [Daktulosphaira vitifoliae]